MAESKHDTEAVASAATNRFELTGGALCLDFANTVDNRPTAATDALRTYADLVDWAEQAQVIPRQVGESLRAEAIRRPAAAEAALAGARALREGLHAIFSAVAAHREVPAEWQALLNAALAPSLARLQLTAPAGASGPAVAADDGSRFTWRWDFDDRALDGVLAPVVESAADLLTSPDLARVRECEADSCAWLFIDRSRNRSRRWCDMAVCGNRAKARRYQARTRKVVFPSPGAEAGGDRSSSG
ncbi:MAG TPA: ABATE domain-containing protein [Vicinamibacterales bacterium]|nr:ABATE domain-containing protein [Vicinamibacterales bacterium]